MGTDGEMEAGHPVGEWQSWNPNLGVYEVKARAIHMDYPKNQVWQG